MNTLITAVLTMFLSTSGGAAEDLGAVKKTISEAVNQVLVVLKDKATDKKTKQEKVMAIVDPIFDFELTAKLALGRKHWPTFSQAEQKEFTDLFVKQLKDSYFEKVDLLTDEKVEFGAPEAKGDKAYMNTFIVSKDQRYQMLYKLYFKGGQWQIYDVEIEGISVVKSYGSQYEQFLAGKAPKDLLARMKEKSFGVPKEFQEKGKTKKDGGK